MHTKARRFKYMYSAAAAAADVALESVIYSLLLEKIRNRIQTSQEKSALAELKLAAAHDVILYAKNARARYKQMALRKMATFENLGSFFFF